MSIRHPLVLAALAVAAPSAGGAQAAPRAPAAPGRPVPLERVGAQLAPGRWTYAARATMNGQTQDVGTRVLTLSRRTPGWLIVLEEQNPMATSTDSLLLQPDLRAERRAVRAQTPQGPATLSLAFSADSIIGSFQAGGQSQPLRVANPRQAAASDAVIMLALGKLPLATGWQGSLDLLNIQNGGIIPLALRVLRSESVTVKAGTFDAWVVEASAGPSQTTFWVAKGGPVVRVVATLPQAAGAQIETALTGM
ncbi:MAG TPA: hypothetical protein VEZ47_07620 [Gemmatirosa sp.]|nr:hypothetical protein [Gemmatirosa sp.]